jgi:glycosyltransferase involved in cell wall biosynthesis
MSRASAGRGARESESVATAPGPICYVLKRFPRLSETFILNEIRALERLGAPLVIVSLLPREAGRHHSTVAEVRARIHYLPVDWLALIRAALRPHLRLIATVPMRYLRTARRALWLAVRYRHPSATFKNFTRAVLVAEICRQEAISHLHAHFANTPTRVAFFVSTLCGIPFSFTAHAKDLFLSTTDAMQDRVTGAKFVLTCTRYNGDYIKSLVPAEHWSKIHVVYHGADLSMFSDVPDTCGAGRTAPDVPPIILSVGRLVPKKGMRCLITACGHLRDRGIAFRCQVVGHGPLRDELHAQIDGLGLGGTVTLLGAMTHDDLVEVYGQATVFALVPQIAEDGDRDGIPNVLVEAMAAGLPVVSTTVSGIPELVEHALTGWLVPPNHPDAVADALEHLLRDEETRQHISIAARRHVTERFECWQSTKAIHALLLEGTQP